MMTAPITPAGLAHILSFRPRLHEDLPGFVKACYDHQILLFFHWPAWKDGVGQRFSTIEAVSQASLLDCRRVLTVLLRQDRFIENSLAHHASSGFLGAVLDRLAVLAGGLPSLTGVPDDPHQHLDRALLSDGPTAAGSTMTTDDHEPPASLSGRHSVYRERIIEHHLVSRLLIEDWRRGSPDLDVLHPEIDRFGYDLVLQRHQATRYVQLKSSLVTAKTAVQNIQCALITKPGGCVVWVLVHEDLEIHSFLTLIPAMGESIETLLDPTALKVSKHSKANAQGEKTERPHLRVVPRARFSTIEGTAALMDALFPPEPIARSTERSSIDHHHGKETK